MRDFAIAGYFGMSWSIITEDHTYIHWLLTKLQPARLSNADSPGKEIMKNEAKWVLPAGAKQKVPDQHELYDRRQDPFH